MGGEIRRVEPGGMPYCGEVETAARKVLAVDRESLVQNLESRATKPCENCGEREARPIQPEAPATLRAVCDLCAERTLHATPGILILVLGLVFGLIGLVAMS